MAFSLRYKLAMNQLCAGHIAQVSRNITAR